MMHFTFYNTTLAAWTVKTIEGGVEVDDSDDDFGADPSVRKRKRLRKGSTIDTSIANSHSHRIMTGADLNETLHTVHVLITDEDELQSHKERVRRADRIMDMFLTRLERGLE